MSDINVQLKEYEEELRKMFICTFGYYEAEEEMILRCLDAIKTKDMECLKQDLVVFCAGDEKVLRVDNTRVSLILHRYGIWQYVKEKIEEQN